MKNKIICVIGPESSSTRFFGDIIGGHPDIFWQRKTGDDHHQNTDPMSHIWDKIDYENTTDQFKIKTDKKYILTRRSIPHGKKKNPNGRADYMDFMNLDTFAKGCKNSGYDLCFLITSRSPVPNIVSWTQQRGSANKKWKKAQSQYWESYKHLFKTITAHNIPFYMLSLEGVLYDKADYINGIYDLLELPHRDDIQIADNNSNKSRYPLYDKVSRYT